MKTNDIDRTVASRLLAKAIAYAQCDKPKEANEHAAALFHYLAQCEIYADTKALPVTAEGAVSK